MTNIVKFTLDKGGEVFFEVSDEDLGQGQELAGFAENVIVKEAKETFDKAIKNVKPVLEKTLETLIDIPKQPEEIEVEIGLKLNGDAGAIFAKIGAEANFKIKLLWK